MSHNYHITTLFLWKLYFSVRIPYKELIWCTNYPNVHIDTFRRRLSFMWGCFFTASILKSCAKKISKVKSNHHLFFIFEQRDRLDFFGKKLPKPLKNDLLASTFTVSKKCSRSKFFWSVFSRIWIEYGDLRSKSLHSL